MFAPCPLHPGSTTGTRRSFFPRTVAASAFARLRLSENKSRPERPLKPTGQAIPRLKPRDFQVGKSLTGLGGRALIQNKT